MTRPVFRRRPGGPRGGDAAVDRDDIAEILRGVAVGRERNGDPDGARRARKSARMVEGRDGPGERYRKHRRTGGTA